MSNVFTNLLKNIGGIFQFETKERAHKTKLKSDDIHNPDEATAFLQALAERINAGDFQSDKSLTMDGNKTFDCDIDMKEAVDKKQIKNSVKIKMTWIEALEEHNPQSLTDEELL
ncbi:hypothetical protein ACQZV8_20155, partial [Magnetococcales bacterium HHB-1]